VRRSRAGVRVAVHCRRSRDEAEAVAASIRNVGGAAEVFLADVADPVALQAMIDAVGKRLGPISILVNNAGPYADTPFAQLEEREWDLVMAANLKAPWLASRAVAPVMRRQGWGRIVNIGATSGLVRSHSIYGLAKAALLHLTESLALELAPEITVNAVVPSQIASARTDTLVPYKKAAIAGTPLKRLVTEEEIGRMVVLLCGPDFDFVTGRPIVMDGGRAIPAFPRIGLSTSETT
jgi:NAD(P)-dependent dehydrogenase (short-subunit alcohol dehydrogenase family)